MQVVFDIEANGLHPDHIWVVVCKELETGEYHVFRNITEDKEERERFLTFATRVTRWIGHNCLGYDLPVLHSLVGLSFSYRFEDTVDTLICSKAIDYPRSGHSLEHYGEEFEIEKDKYSDFTRYSVELENRCIRDVDLTEKVYLKYRRYLTNPDHLVAMDLEHWFQMVTDGLSTTGFYFNTEAASVLLDTVTTDLAVTDGRILSTFGPKLTYIRTVTPKETKYGTISLASIPKALRKDIADFTVGAPFSYCHWVDFNPNSHKQIISVLGEAGWRPVDKTDTHKDTEREYNKLRNKPLDEHKQNVYNKLVHLQETGWKVNENNLETLPPEAPNSARLLAKRILLESRRRTLTEWLDLVEEDGRIHGRFQGLGAWTHRMSHQSPNTANIPNEFDTSGKKKLLGKELRSLWRAPKNRLLVGVDAEGIQLRIFAHYINDPEFTEALVNGRKEEKTDPHSLNQRVLGDVCKSRQSAKRYIYALLLGAGKGKLREILDCDERSADQAYDRLLERYTGFAYLKETIIPRDAKRGWFVGLDGRRVRIPGDGEGGRRHLAMSGYLQNGEAVVMKSATLKWWQKLEDYDAKLVNFVHDEWQIECPNDMKIALEIAEMVAQSLPATSKELGLLCPMAGSYWNDDLKDYTIGTRWSVTH